MIRCTHDPHLQAWGMMRYWGVEKRPQWHVEWIKRVNASLAEFGLDQA